MQGWKRWSTVLLATSREQVILFGFDVQAQRLKI